MKWYDNQVAANER